MFLTALTATFLPSSCLGDLMELPFFTVVPMKSAPFSEVEAAPFATALTGTFLDWAISRDVVLLKPNWNWPETTPGTIAAPPWAGVISSLRPRFS